VATGFARPPAGMILLSMILLYVCVYARGDAGAPMVYFRFTSLFCFPFVLFVSFVVNGFFIFLPVIFLPKCVLFGVIVLCPRGRGLQDLQCSLRRLWLSVWFRPISAFAL
jgi:hypothetical protein